MVKNKKRIFFTLFLIVSAILLSSCSSYGFAGENDDGFSLSGLNVPDDYSKKEQILADLSGDFIVVSEAEEAEELFASYSETDIFSKAVFERNSKIYTEYSVQISHRAVNDIVSYAKNAQLSSTEGFDMLLTSAADAGTLILDGSLMDLASVSEFDAKKEGYSDSLIEQLSLGRSVYLTAGDAIPSLLRNASAVMVNTELLSHIEGGSELLKIVKNGHFTYDTMLKFSLALKELNGADGDSSYGIKVGEEDALPLFLSGGGAFYGTDNVTDRPFAVDFGERNRKVYSSFMKLFGYDVENASGVTYTASGKAATPLFIVSTVGRVEALAAENAPFKAIPMPKLNEAQTRYASSIDISSAVFSAVPAGANGALSVTVMDIIYETSVPLAKMITDNCEGSSAASGNPWGSVSLINDSLSAYLLSILNYGDMPELINDSVHTRISGKAFEMKGNERSKAAAAALSIIMNAEKSQK